MTELNFVLSPAQKKAQFRSLVALFLMILGSLGLDQVTKIQAERNLMTWESDTDLKQYQGSQWPVWSFGSQSSPLDEDPPFYLAFSFNYVRNQGAAWGFLSDLDDAFRIPFFYGVTLLAVIVIFLYLRSTPLSHRLARFTLALVLSGALGNFTDRIMRGYVVDFIDVRWVIPLPLRLSFEINFFPEFLDFLNFSLNTQAFRYNFPNFNWADSAITVGVILLMIDMLVLEKLRLKQLHSEG